MAWRIVVLDVPEGELRDLEKTFAAAAGEGARVDRVGSLKALEARLASDEGCDLVVLDDSQPRALAAVRALDPELPAIVVAEEGDVDKAAQAIRAGATDFLVRRHRLDERVSTQLEKIRRLLGLVEENRSLARRLRESENDRYALIGSSPAIRRLLETARRVAAVPRPVLITGERGTGKELLARAIHDFGGPPGRPIVIVNCAAFPDDLLESELFGHERGAFTGAERTTRGKFEQAHRGTLFLDEIGNTSIAFQQKILRVVEYGEFTRVGGTLEIRVETRIVAATNADLRAKMDGGTFLRDLYDRLAFEVLHLPPLRERPGDVAVLAHHFLERFMAEVPAFRGKRLSGAALEALRGYPFPGNVRELRNLIERAVYRETGEEITPGDLGLPAETPSLPATSGTFHEQLESLERSLVRRALAEAGGNQAEAARRLGLSYHQFRHYHKKHAPGR
mgnify:CR=1 FL=1